MHNRVRRPRPQFDDLEPRRLLTLLGVGPLLTDPQMQLDFGSASYNATTHALHVHILAEELTGTGFMDGPIDPLADVDINLTVDNTGHLITGGPTPGLLITQDLDSNHVIDPSEILLQGDIITGQFGFDSSGTTEYKFLSTFGFLHPFYGGSGLAAGLSLNFIGSALSFAANFDYANVKGTLGAISSGPSGGDPPPAKISGTKFLDVTGNGLTADDTPLGGVTVNLYADSNGSGSLETTGLNPDTLVTSTLTSTTPATLGTYSFTVNSPGQYFVSEVVPAGYVRTAPALATYYSATVLAGQTVGGLNFANAEKCDPASITNIAYYVNDVRFSDLRGHVRQGDLVQVVFTVRPGYNESYSLVSYEAPGSSFDANTASQQSIYQVASTGAVGAGTYTLSVRAPDCYFQVDFVCGDPIDHFGPAGSNIFYSAQSRLHSADNGGTVGCRPDEASVSGFAYVDANNDGIKQSTELPLAGVAITLKNAAGATILTRLTASDGSYYFGNLAPGDYRLTEAQPASYVDGLDTIGSQGGTSPANDTLAFSLAAHQDGTANNFGEQLTPNSSLSGFVFVDYNNDGDIDMTDTGIEGVTVTLRGTDVNGRSVLLTTTTDEEGFYKFDSLLPGTYSIKESQPAGYTDGKDVIGSQGGVTSNDLFSNVLIGAGVNGINNNFGELTTGRLVCGDTATIGFWHNKNGQALINCLNGRSTSTALGNWLAETFPNIWGTAAGTNNLAGKTNAQVAAYYQTQFSVTGMKLNAQVMAVAFAVYSTNSNLAGTVASGYGFNVSLTGTGARVINVGGSGAAFGVANYTLMTVNDILAATNVLSAGGSGSTRYDIYNGNTALRTLANTVYDYINTTGDRA